MIKFYLIMILALSLLFPQSIVLANEANCDNRYLTLVNPVRGRNLWDDKSLKPIEDQYQLISENDLAATWLLQYDALIDSDLKKYIGKFNSKQELGVFLEVSSNLAQKARVIYPYNAAWFEPEAVFLSGYSQSDRRKLIDKLFTEFKTEYGYFPKSVGAWWIDGYSLNYLTKKYGITSALIVADQKTTDSYSVWGQWWGVPYYSSFSNPLTPANKSSLVMIQWAQRDPLNSVGNGWQFSNHSLQANDYPDLGLDINYFKTLTQTYLSCQNKVGQITVGLETGQESIQALGEYKNQLEFLKKKDNLQSVTMSDFSQKYQKIFPEIKAISQISREDSIWQMTLDHRTNNKYQETVKYDAKLTFKDYFIADKSKMLNRVLPIENNLKYDPVLNFTPLLILSLLGIWSYFKRIFKIYLSTFLVLISGFGLLLKSNFQYGWLVFYGPVVEPLALIQTLVIIFSFVLIYLLTKTKFLSPNIKKTLIWIFPLTFGFDYLIQILRFSLIEKKYYFGIALDSLRFLGFSFDKNFEFVNRDFVAYQAAAFLRFNFDKIWNNLWFTFLFYPLLHLLVAFVVAYFLILISKKAHLAIVIILMALFVLNLITILNADPRLVLP